MDTENSLWYFRGKEARRNHEILTSGYRLRGLNWVAWRKGWEEQDAAMRRDARSPEQRREADEAAKYLDEELAKWRDEVRTQEEAERERDRRSRLPVVDGMTAFFPAEALR